MKQSAAIILILAVSCWVAAYGLVVWTTKTFDQVEEEVTYSKVPRMTPIIINGTTYQVWDTAEVTYTQKVWDFPASFFFLLATAIALFPFLVGLVVIGIRYTEIRKRKTKCLKSSPPD